MTHENTTRPPAGEGPLDRRVVLQREDARMNLLAALREKTARTAETQGAGFRRSTVTDMVMNTLPRRISMAYKHAAGEYDTAATELTAAAQRMEAALEGLLTAEKNTSEKAKAAVGRAKDTAAQLGDSLARVNRLLGQDFEARLAQVERLADALTKLAELERGGRLQGVMAALGRP